MKFNKISTIFLLALIVTSCQSEYTKLVKKELESGQDNKALFYGLELGQTQKEFYDICWGLNKKGIATHGGNNQNVKVILYPQDSTQKTKKIQMLFYPTFSPDKDIIAMKVNFSYLAWSPWNKTLQADDLLPVVKDTLLKWYPGNKFIQVKDFLVKVDGNRQIQLNKVSNKDVGVVIEDLDYKYNKLIK